MKSWLQLCNCATEKNMNIPFHHTCFTIWRRFFRSRWTRPLRKRGPGRKGKANVFQPLSFRGNSLVFRAVKFLSMYSQLVTQKKTKAFAVSRSARSLSGIRTWPQTRIRQSLKGRNPSKSLWRYFGTTKKKLLDTESLHNMQIYVYIHLILINTYMICVYIYIYMIYELPASHQLLRCGTSPARFKYRSQALRSSALPLQSRRSVGVFLPKCLLFLDFSYNFSKCSCEISAVFFMCLLFFEFLDESLKWYLLPVENDQKISIYSDQLVEKTLIQTDIVSMHQSLENRKLSAIPNSSCMGWLCPCAPWHTWRSTNLVTIPLQNP